MKLKFFFPALNNPHYNVPAYLIQMAQEENLQLQEQRYRSAHLPH